MNWGNYALEIPFVKVAQLIGMLSPSGYTELAEVCVNLAKFDCAKGADLDMFEKTGDLRGLEALAKLQMRLGENQNALSTSARYFRSGGKSAETGLNYGRLLLASGQSEMAIQYFDFAIANSGDVLPVQATTEKVRLMIKLGKYDQALASIESFYQSAGNAKGYLNTEHTQLEDYMSKQAKSTGRGHKKSSGKPIA